MRKFYRYFFLPFLLFVVTQVSAIQIGGITYKVDTLENHQVGPGTQFISLRLTATGRRIDVFFLKTDLKNPYVEIHTALGRDSIYTGEPTSVVAKRKSTEGAFYFAGTNGDFYATSGYIGYPVSGNMVDGEIAKIPGSRNVFVMDDQKIPGIGIANFSGKLWINNEEYSIHSSNHLRETNWLVLYNQLNGRSTRTNKYGTEVLIEMKEGYEWGTNKVLKAKVLKVEKEIGNMAIPKGKAVLSGNGTAAVQLNQLNVNDDIEFVLNVQLGTDESSNFVQMTGGDNYATMLLNGNVEQTNVWNEQHPRTGLGYSRNRDSLIFCVIDGRGVSNGATTKDLAELMKSAGAYTAFNMDGGGSSTMYIAEYGQAVNKTSDGPERAVANSIYVVATSPSDTLISIIKPYKPSISLPRYGEFTPQFYGYNQYEVLLEPDVQNVELSCPASLGKIQGNKFIATGDTPGKITATYNGTISTTIDVNIVPVSEIKIRLDSVIVDNRTDYPIEVIGTTGSGQTSISPAALTWTVSNTEICTVENGKVKALKNGTTTISGELDGVTDFIKINVEIPESMDIIGDSISLEKWELEASSFLKAQLNTNNLPDSWEHGAVVNFTYAAGRSPYVEMIMPESFFGLPDTVKMVLNIGDIDISRALFSLKANDASKVTTLELTAFEQNKDFTLNIPIDQLFDVSDRAIYPIWFDKVRFYLNASGMTAGKAYALAAKEIRLIYNDILPTGISSVKESRFKIFPNPVKNQLLFIQLNETATQNVRAEVYDLNGRKLSEKYFENYGGEILEIPVSFLTPGVYLLKIYENEKPDTLKFIVQ
ncbi:hypothetical protein MASR2M47_41690 [Draconibacterium sp.]